MDQHCECGACNARTLARPPNKAFWWLIVAFWLVSLALGFGALRTGWSVVLIASWAAIASAVVLLARRATSWTCSECGSVVVPPFGASRGEASRHA